MTNDDFTLEDQMGQHWNEHNEHQEREDGQEEYPQEEAGLELPVSPVALRGAAEVHEQLGDGYAEQAEELARQYSPSEGEQVIVAALYRHVAACQRLLAQAERTIWGTSQNEGAQGVRSVTGSNL